MWVVPSNGSPIIRWSKGKALNSFLLAFTFHWNVRLFSTGRFLHSVAVGAAVSTLA